MKKQYIEMSGEKFRVFEDKYYEKPISDWITFEEFEKRYGKMGIDWNSIELEDKSLR